MQPTRNCSGTLQVPDRKKNGGPEVTLRMLLNCHPPTILSANPPWFKNRLPFPIGSSYVNAQDSTCGTSSCESPLLRLRSKGEMTPVNPLQVAASACVFSEVVISFEKVYEANIHIPCENLFSALN